jgi:hypothetical protein
VCKGFADEDWVDRQGRTALMWAAIGLHDLCAKQLIEMGCDPTTVDGNEYSALDHWREAVHESVVAGKKDNVLDVEAVMVEAMEVTTMRREQYALQGYHGKHAPHSTISEAELKFDISVKIVASDTKAGYTNLGMVNLPYAATLTQARAVLRSSRLVLPGNMRFLRPDLDYAPEDFLDPPDSSDDDLDDGYGDDNFEDEGPTGEVAAITGAVAAAEAGDAAPRARVKQKRVKKELNERQVLLFNRGFDTGAFGTKSVILLEEVLAGWERRFEARALRTLWVCGVSADRSRPPTTADMGFIPPPMASAKEVQALLKAAKEEMMKTGMTPAQMKAQVAKMAADAAKELAQHRGVMVSCDFRMVPLGRLVVKYLNEHHEKMVGHASSDGEGGGGVKFE